MTLLLGPPASGKSTLLLALVGKLDTSLKKSGKITYNGYELHEFCIQRTSAYISQTNNHIAELTVRETLDFHLQLWQHHGYPKYTHQPCKKTGGLYIRGQPNEDVVYGRLWSKQYSLNEDKGSPYIPNKNSKTYTRLNRGSHYKNPCTVQQIGRQISRFSTTNWSIFYLQPETPRKQQPKHLLFRLQHRTPVCFWRQSRRFGPCPCPLASPNTCGLCSGPQHQHRVPPGLPSHT